MTSIDQLIAENLSRVQARIEEACARVGRDRNAVTLIAVTKYARPEWVHELVGLGVLDLGESRPAQLVQRAQCFPKNVRWHMVGHLQRNKVTSVLPLATLIHSVDSVRLLERIERLAEQFDIHSNVLLEVNVSGESSKDGFRPDELERAWPTILSFRRARVTGLMTMAPLMENFEESRRVFAELRRLRDRLSERSPSGISLQDLSMGMSSDFETAIEEGATMIRLGTILFEGLP